MGKRILIFPFGSVELIAGRGRWKCRKIHNWHHLLFILKWKLVN